MAITKLMNRTQQIYSAEEYEERRRIVENMDTERLAENVEVENRLAQAREEEVKTEQLSDDLDRADREIETMESYVEHLRFCANNGGLDPKGMAMYNIAVEAIHERLGIPRSQRNYVSLEAFNGVASRSTATLIAIEEESNKITEWLKAAWKWVVDLLKRISDTVTSLFSSKKAILNRIEALRTQLDSVDDVVLSKEAQWKSESQELNKKFFGSASFLTGLENTSLLIGSKSLKGSLPSVDKASKNIKDFLNQTVKDLKTLSDKLDVGEGETVESKFSDLEGEEKGKILAKLQTEFNKRGVGKDSLISKGVEVPNRNATQLMNRVWAAIEDNSTIDVELLRRNDDLLKIQVSVNPKDAISTGKGCLPGYHAYIQTVVNSDTKGLFSKKGKDGGAEDVFNPNQFNAFFTSLMSDQESDKVPPKVPLTTGKVNKTILKKALDLCVSMVENGDKVSQELKTDMKDAESALDGVVSQIPSKANSVASRVFRFLFSATRTLIKSLYNPIFKAITFTIQIVKGFLDAVVAYINSAKSKEATPQQSK